MSSASVLSVLWRVSEALTCPLCRHLLSRPSTLPCSHHVCRDCLRQHCALSATGGVGGVTECVCPIEGCQRPLLSTEGYRDNRQLHHLTVAFTAMRDAILHQQQQHHTTTADQQQSTERSWPNQVESAANDRSDSDSSADSSQRTTKRARSRGRPPQRTHTLGLPQGQGQGQRKRGGLHSRQQRVQEREVDEEENEAEAQPGREYTQLVPPADTVDRGPSDGVEWVEAEVASQQDELLGDREARLRMRSRMRWTRQQQLQRAHMSDAHRTTKDRAEKQRATDVNESRTTDKPLVDQAHMVDTQRESGASASGSTASRLSSPPSPTPCSSHSAAADCQSVSLPSSRAIRCSSARSIVLSSASRSHSRVVQQAIQQLGGATVAPSTGTDWCDTVTHVVCCNTSEERLVKRTMKYMVGVMSGCWVVEWQWIVDSIAAGRWLSELDYEIKGDSIAGATYAARRAREERQTSAVEQLTLTDSTHQQPHSRSISPSTSALFPTSHCSLLLGCCVAVMEPLSPQCPTMAGLTLLIRMAGGQLLLPAINIANTSEQAAATGEQAVVEWVDEVQKQLPSSPAPATVIVLCRPSLMEAVNSGECAPLSALQPLSGVSGVQLISISWLLDSIGAFRRLPFHPSPPTNTNGDTHGATHSGMYALTHLIPRG